MDVDLSSDLAEETGIHIGDGSMNFYSGRGYYTVACHWIDDREYMEKHVVPLINKIYKKSPKLRNWSKGTYGFRICSKEILNFKKEKLGLPLGKKRNIKIPKEIFENDTLVKSCIMGIFDTDGCLNLENKYGKLYPRIIISTTSKSLFFQLKSVLTRLEFNYSSWSRKNNPNWNETNIIRLNGFKNLEKWMNEIGTNNPKHLKKVEKLIKEKYINDSFSTLFCRPH